MDPELRKMFENVTKGALSAKAGENPKEEFKVNGQYVNTPERVWSAFRSTTNT
jgi:hypothetical protein